MKARFPLRIRAFCYCAPGIEPEYGREAEETDQKGSEERRSKGTPEKGFPSRPQSDTAAF